MNRRSLAKGATIALVLTITAGADSNGQEKTTEPVPEYRLDADTLARFSPRARADLVAVILQQWKIAKAADINTTPRVHHFLAQMATETGGFRVIAENMNYSADRLLKVFPRRVTPEQAQRLAHNPVAIANHVYNGRLGNRLSNDGWDYRGSGLIQLTGRANFASRGLELNLPLENNPELVRTPAAAFQAAVAFWTARKLNDIADTDELHDVRVAVNGGTNGLPEARVWLARAQRYLIGAAPRDADEEESVAIEGTLRSLGFLGTPKSGDRNAPDEVDTAVKEFQRSRGLPETGQVDEDTLYELVDPDNFRREDR
jgi:predicted chitinase